MTIKKVARKHPAPKKRKLLGAKKRRKADLLGRRFKTPKSKPALFLAFSHNDRDHVQTTIRAIIAEMAGKMTHSKSTRVQIITPSAPRKHGSSGRSDKVFVIAPGRTTLGRKKRTKLTNVTARNVYGTDGQPKTVFAVDAGSATLGSDLRYAFERNVAEARRENKKRFGSTEAPIEGR